MKNGYAMIDIDDEVLEDLLLVVNPDEQDLVTLGAITKRYPFPHPLAILAQDIAEGWGLTEQQLMTRCRFIWSSGFRPTHFHHAIGSANDTQQEDS